MLRSQGAIPREGRPLDRYPEAASWLPFKPSVRSFLLLKYCNQLRHLYTLQAAKQAGTAAGFRFDAAAEMRDVFLVHGASIATFHETRL